MRIKELSRNLDNPVVGYDLLRIYLGFALLVRGALFAADPVALTNLMQRSGHWFMPVLISHYVVGAHVAGGILLVLGLITRVAALAQVPILLGALLFAHWGEGLLSADQSLELSALVLVMLLVISAFGAGHLSLDYSLARKSGRKGPTTPSSPPDAEHEHEHAHAHP